jgi:hypothetical protein
LCIVAKASANIGMFFELTKFRIAKSFFLPFFLVFGRFLFQKWLF